MEHVTEAAGNSKRQARPPTDHFEKLFKEMCLNHTYSVKHKLRDCGMMKSFMTTGSLPRGMEITDDPTEGDTTPFPGEDAIKAIFGRHPSLEKHHALDQGWGDAEM
jgi:hypothetical protein